MLEGRILPQQELIFCKKLHSADAMDQTFYLPCQTDPQEEILSNEDITGVFSELMVTGRDRNPSLLVTDVVFKAKRRGCDDR